MIAIAARLLSLSWVILESVCARLRRLEGCRLVYQSARKKSTLSKRDDQERIQPASWNPTRVPRSLPNRIGPSIPIRHVRTGQVAWTATAGSTDIMITRNSHRHWEWAGAQLLHCLLVLRIVSGKLVLCPRHVVRPRCYHKLRGGLQCPPTWTMDTQTPRSRALPCNRALLSCNHILLLSFSHRHHQRHNQHTRHHNALSDRSSSNSSRHSIPTDKR